MSVTWEYKIGNRKVSKRNWEKHVFHDAPHRMAREAIENKLRSVRCPTHGDAPRLTIDEARQGFTVNISGCCEALVRRAQRALA